MAIEIHPVTTERRDILLGLVDDGSEPGVLAYRDGEPVGWCAVGPRERSAKDHNAASLFVGTCRCSRVRDSSRWPARTIGPWSASNRSHTRLGYR